eukprot:2012891-Lingulodinium_polyedra.AAC.1
MYAPEELHNPVRGGGEEFILHRAHGGHNIVDNIAAEGGTLEGVEGEIDARILEDALATVGEGTP